MIKNGFSCCLSCTFISLFHSLLLWNSQVLNHNSSNHCLNLQKSMDFYKDFSHSIYSSSIYISPFFLRYLWAQYPKSWSCDFVRYSACSLRSTIKYISCGFRQGHGRSEHFFHSVRSDTHCCQKDEINWLSDWLLK